MSKAASVQEEKHSRWEEVAAFMRARIAGNVQMTSAVTPAGNSEGVSPPDTIRRLIMLFDAQRAVAYEFVRESDAILH